MGIATSTGVIRDFAGPYHVSEDNMAFGKPTKYWQLDYTKAKGSIQGWDAGVAEASEIYKTRMVIKSFKSEYKTLMYDNTELIFLHNILAQFMLR